jgi:hypothetical protein
MHRYRALYYSLPFPLAKLLDEIYKILGINIHDPSPLPLDVEEIVPEIDVNTIDDVIHQPRIH